MGFLDTLRLWRSPETKIAAAMVPESAREQFLKQGSDTTLYSDYDREQWRKKLKRLLSGVHESESDWADLHQEAGSLGFGEDWVKSTSRQEFALLIRKIVSDQEVTDDEHHVLDRARDHLGIPDKEAEAIFRTVVSEAEAFFGSEVRGG